jgi:hypothetical protein
MAMALAEPSRRVSSEGKPKMPLPMPQLMITAVIVQRPNARTKGTPHPATDRHSVAPNYVTEIVNRTQDIDGTKLRAYVLR